MQSDGGGNKERQGQATRRDRARLCSTTTGIRRSEQALCVDAGCRRRCCWASRWCSDAKRMAASSPCAITARIAAFLSPAGASTATRSPASIMAGPLSRLSGQCMEIPSLDRQRRLSAAHPCHGLSLPRGRRICLGVCARTGQRPGEHGSAGGALSGTGDAEVRRQVPQRASVGGSSRPRGSWHHRPYGSGARPLRSSGLVVALRAQHP